jgi:outer membrane translocation and assembly module TamA
MSLQRVARANVLRHLRLGDALSHQTRVIGVQNQLRRLSLATNSRFSTPLAGSFSLQSRSFATETADSTSPKKSTKKSTTKKPKAEKKKPKRALTEKQKEAKEKKESRELVKQLKETALQPPKKLAATARSIATQHKLKEVREQNPSRPQAEIFKEAVELVNSGRLAEADVCQISMVILF